MATEILLSAIGGFVLLVAAVGCFVPVIPGPVVAYAALWLPMLFGLPVSTQRLVAGAAVVAVVCVVDYVLPAVCARKFKCSGWGVFGCFVGSIVGLFFFPLGIVLGPFLGTIAGELIAGKELAASFRGGFGALVGFVLCLAAKLATVGLFAWWFFSSFAAV